MADKIDVLDHIRKRPQMYVGALDHLGFNEIIHYLIEDFIATEFYDITLTLEKDNRIILESFCNNSSTFVWNAIENINDYEDGSFCLSIAGLVALSESLKMEFNDVPVFNSHKGLFEIESGVVKDASKLKFEFTIDREIFKNLELNYRFLNLLLKRFAFLNSKLKIKSIDHSSSELQINVFNYPKGISEIVDFELSTIAFYDTSFFRINVNEETNYVYSVAIAFIGGWNVKPKTKLYANYKETILGGSLLNGILQGFKDFFNEESLKIGLNIRFSISDFRKHLFIFGSVTGDLIFLGSTRWKLGTPKVQKEIRQFIYRELKVYFENNKNQLLEIVDILQDDF